MRFFSPPQVSRVLDAANNHPFITSLALTCGVLFIGSQANDALHKLSNTPSQTQDNNTSPKFGSGRSGN